MSEQTTALQSWLQEWTDLAAAAKGIAERLQSMAMSAPPPQTPEDVDRTLRLRERLGGIDGPATAAALRDAAERAGRGFPDLCGDAGLAMSALLTTAERSFERQARDGANFIAGDALPSDAWGFIGPMNGRLIVVFPAKLPDGHALKNLLPPDELYQSGRGPAVVLGRAEIREGHTGDIISPKRWYPVSDAPRWTRNVEAERQREEAEREHVQRIADARAAAEKEARERADPHRRLDKLEAELASLKQGTNA